MNRKTKNIILSIYVIALLILIVGSTYAYFTMVKVSSVSPQIDIGTATTNFIVFDAGNPINMTITQENFQMGMGNQMASTFASAYLRQDGGTNPLSFQYNLFLNILENNLEYTTNEKVGELLLKVTDPNGEELKSIAGLNYVTVVDGEGKKQSGFDITKSVGKYYIAYNYNIKTTTEIMHKWNAQIMFVNLGSDQNKNINKELKGYIQIEKAG